MQLLFVVLLLSLSVFSVSANSQKQTVLILGDSLTEGYGVEKDQTFPAVLERLLQQQKKTGVRVYMAGIGGATTASGLERLKYHLKDNPEILVLALGGNDGLRGLKVKETKRNLRETLVFAKSKRLKVLLAGMKVPPNYGPDYAKDFEKMFVDLAREEKVNLMPFLLEGVAGEVQFNQEDGIHPNEKGHEVVAKNLLKYLEKLL